MTSLDVVIPVYNEELGLARSVMCLREFLARHMPDYRWRVVVANNGSTDHTLEIAEMLANRFPDVEVVHLEQKGRGRSLKRAWTESDADVLSYMDVDLSTDLAALPPLAWAVAHEGYDVAIGSRHVPGARLKRSLKRDILSRGYNLIVRAMFRTGFHDAQCGFKAVGQRVVRELVPVIEDNHWFFDSELLIVAEKRGYRIKEVPVDWREDADSRVRIVSTVKEDLKGLLRLRFRGLPQPVHQPSGSPSKR